MLHYQGTLSGTEGRGEKGRRGRKGGGGEGDFFGRDGSIVIGPLHARTYKSMTADNPLFKINIVAFFSSTNEASPTLALNKHIATRNPLILVVCREK